MEGQQRGEVRQVTSPTYKHLVKSALDSEWSISQSEFLHPEPCWLNFLSGCTNLRATGCILCWILVAGSFYRGKNSALLAFFSTLAPRLTTGSLSSRARLAPGAFPIREGELAEVRSVMSFTEFKEVMKPEFVDEWFHQAWTYVLVFGLNALYGSVAAPGLGRWTKTERRAVESLRDVVSRRCQFEDSLVASVEEIDKELKSKFVGYCGEEVSKCYPLTLEQILPSLPPEEHGGSIDAVNWLGSRSKEFLLHPERCLLEEQDIPPLKLPGKVHVRPGQEIPLALELVKRGVCRWIPLEAVHEVRGKKLLNGLFGVEKPSRTSSGSPVLRVIMNLVPSNACLKQLQGAIENLPSISSWQGVVLEGDEELELHQSDMSSAFYLFKLPEVWGPYLAFNIVVQGKSVGHPEIEHVALCSNVVPMGWASSVGLMQEMSENLLTRQGISMQHQIRKGKSLPAWMNEVLVESRRSSRYWWHVYLDNFCAGERCLPSQPGRLGRICHEEAEAAWNSAGVISSAKKRKASERRIEELGAEISSHHRSLGASPLRWLSLIHVTLYILSKRYINKKELQVVLGRWTFMMQFRRPAMSIFDQVWGMSSGTMKKRGATSRGARQELVLALCLSPLFFTSLSAGIPPCISASDASSTGGAWAIARNLTDEGENFLTVSQLLEDEVDPCPILVISLFNGIGGAFRCYDVAGIPVAGRISFDICKEANRVTSKAWPSTLIYTDVKSITPKLVEEWSLRFTTISEVHIWAGFPCVDLSSVRAGRLNLGGSQSKLFYEIPRVKQLCEDGFGPQVTVKSLVENVASMDAEAAEQISELLGSIPYKMDSADAVPMHRPRYAWSSETLEEKIPGVSVEKKAYWKEVSAPAPYPPTSSWLQPGFVWNGESVCVFPTCMKAIPRVFPPKSPAGLAKCDGPTISRWRSDEHRYPPYQYKSQYLIINKTSGTWRLLSPPERELLLGYGIGHTRSCLCASEAKGQDQRFEDLRCSLLGDSFSIYSFVMWAVALSYFWAPRVPYTHLAARAGLAPGFRAPWRLVAPMSRSLSYGKTKIQNLSVNKVETLNRMLLRRTNHTGSDVRIITGEVLNPKCFPRQAVASKWWIWEPVAKVRWSKSEHINSLELEAILLTLKHYVLNQHFTNSRIFHLTDSYVCMSIIAKGRSGSRILAYKLKKLAALCLAFGLQLVVAHVDSADNPTDHASRS